MWTLIITILWYHAPAVASIPNFQSYEACNIAAKVEREALKPLADYGSGAAIQVTYVCIKMSNP